jgi:alpha-amylase
MSKPQSGLVLASFLARGAAQGAIVYSGPLNIVSTYSNNGNAGYDGYGRKAINLINDNDGPDFVFGYDTASDKPYLDARSTIGATNGLVYILANTDGTSGNGDGGLPVTPAGTTINASYADRYPGNTNDNEGMLYENDDNNAIVGGWTNNAIIDAYVGIELNLQSGTSYGWLHFKNNPLTSSPALLLEDWAYESTPNTGIQTGDTGLPQIQNSGLTNGLYPQIAGAGVPGYTYGVNSTTNLNGPWLSVGPATATPNGLLGFTDTNQPQPSLFYRLRYPYSPVPPASQVMILGFMMGPEWLGRDGSGNSLWETNSTWAVPCPDDTNSIGGLPSQWWYDSIATSANSLATNGLTSIWLPSFSKGCFGMRGSSTNVIYEIGGIYDTGYGIFDDYDLGDKPEMGNYQTRYGTREQLNRCIAMLRANGLNAYVDMLLNDRNGPNIAAPTAPAYQWFQYQDAYGDPGGGRFPKYYGDFHPGSGPSAAEATTCTNDPDVPATTYPNGTPTGQAEGFFGPDFAPVCGEYNVNGVADVGCAQELQNWGDWLINATGVQGYRLDDCIGISWDWLKNFVNYGAMSGKFTFAEVTGAPYNAYQLQAWMQTCMGQSSANFTMFDQLLEPALWAMCNNNDFWMPAMQSKYLSWGSDNGTNAMDPSAISANPGSLDIYRSVMSVDPTQVVTVVNEVDSDSPILGNPPSAIGPDRSLFGYAYIMTIGFGTPCVDWKDWSPGAGCYGGYAIGGQNLQHWINNLIWCHQFVTTGGFGREQVNSSSHVYAFERTGGGKALIFLNSDWTSAETITFTTDIPNGTVLQDYTGHSFTPVTVSGGKVNVTVPTNANGRGYLVLAPTGITGTFSPAQSSVTQEWEANSDLSIPPASGIRSEVCRVWVDNGQQLAASLADYNTTNWSGGTQLTLEIDQSSLNNATNTFVASQDFGSSMKGQALTITNLAAAAGFYSFYVTGINLPNSGGPWWFKLRNTYTSSQSAPASFSDSGTIYH